VALAVPVLAHRITAAPERRMACPGVGAELRAGSPQAARIARAVGAIAGRADDRAQAAGLGRALTATRGAVATVDLLETRLAR
jgi:hypothetical protein